MISISLQSINLIKSPCLLPYVVRTLFSAHIFEDFSINKEVMHNAVEFLSVSQESKPIFVQASL